MPKRVESEEIMAQILERVKTPMRLVSPQDDWRKRFSDIRWNYAQYAELVRQGKASWCANDSYRIAYWQDLFTPIEAALWHEIRRQNLAMWPQLPVGKYFVDFGNPELKIAIECDGEEFHDWEQDARRDREMQAMGWQLYRIPGWRCLHVVPDPGDLDQLSEEDRCMYAYEVESKTAEGFIRNIANSIAVTK